MDYNKMYKFHVAEWWWGKSITVVCKLTLSLVEMQIESKSPQTMYLKGLIVSEETRRRGVGTSLMTICEHYAKEYHCNFMQLSADKNNEWLVAWYERLGFVKQAEDDNEYIMIKKV